MAKPLVGPHRLSLALLALIPLALPTACGGEAGTPTPKTWQLVLQVDGTEVRLPLEVMDVYLVEDEESWPETFMIKGPGVRLVGQFPLDVHVGYGEDWKRLFNKPISIGTVEGDGEDTESTITLPDRGELNIVDGEFVAEQLTGKYSGQSGDLTLSGRITLYTGDGEVMRGTFSVHGVTWG